MSNQPDSLATAPIARPERVGILLVDDTPANLVALRSILDDDCYDLVEVRSGEEAIERLKDREFAVVLLDVRMPGLSGFDTAKLIRADNRTRNTPIIFLTADDIDREELEAGYALGAVDFFVKPLSPVIVQAKVGGVVTLFQQKERAKQEAEQFRLLVQGTTDYAIFMLDPHGRVATWNSGAERFKQYKADEIIGQHFSKFYPQDVIDRGWPEHELTVATAEGRFEDEGWRLRKDGSRFWANVIITALKDERGKLLGFSKITRDLTERKQAEENARRLAEEAAARQAAHEERERLRVTLASIGDAVISTDAQGRVDFLNPVAEELVGWKPQEAVGRALQEVFCIVNENTRQPVENPALRALRDGKIVGLANHTVLISKQGTEHPIDDSAAPIRDATGNLIGSVLVFRDISERKLREQDLRASEARKSAVMETSLDAIISMDHEGRVVEFNPAAERTFGYSRDQVIGQELCNFIIPSSLRQKHREGMAHYLKTGEGPVLGKRLELPALRADGTEFPVELAITRITTDGPPLFTAYLRDITQQKRAEQHRNTRLAVTQGLSQAEDVRKGVMHVLRAVSENLGWDVGFVWTPNEKRSALSCLQSWHTPGLPVADFEQASCSRTFASGEGLPGRVWATAKPAWILDVTSDPEFPRAASAAKYGLHSAVASPIIVGEKSLGVIEFFTRRIREPDDELLELMGTMAGNVGQFIERRRAEEELRASAERLSLALSAADLGDWSWDAASDIVTFSERAAEVFGIPPGPHMTWAEMQRLLHEDDRERAKREVERVIAERTQYDIEYRVNRQDGSQVWIGVLGRAIYDTADQVVGMYGVVQDVTQRKRAEQTARFLADASAALAVLVDFDSTLQKVASLAVPHFADWVSVDVLEENGNLRRVAMAHVDPAKVQLANDLHCRFPPDPSAPNGVWHILRTGEAEIVPEITDEMLVASIKHDELLSIMRELGLKSYIGVPLTVRGKTLGVLTFIVAESGQVYDDTDLAVAQDLASRAAVAIENTQLYRELRDADRRKDEFLATLAHELRNPLAPIRSGLEVMRLTGGGGEMVDEARSMMERQLTHMVRLVDDLLDVSRITRNKLELRKERVALATVIHTAVETSRPMIEQFGHTFSVTLAPTPVYLDADPVRLAQVFSNLLTNAAKYTEPGGKITLTAEQHGAEAEVRVKDNGLGIPVEAQPRIFEMFSQVDRNMERAQGGLGIGLTLVRRLAEMHGGSVEVSSDGPGKGSEFIVRIPVLKEAQQRSGGRSSDTAAVSGSKRRILVVDDNRDAAESLAMMLKLMGSETRTAADGIAAVEVAETYRPEMILMDIGLPKLNGYDACRRIREQPWSNGMVMVALTGWGQEEDRRRSQEAGFDHHLVKPVDMEKLAKLLDHVQ